MSSVSGGTNLARVTKVSSKQVLITILPVVLCILLNLPVSRAKKEVTVKDADGKNNETLSKPPANIEEVLSKTRKFVPSNTNDDFWVGSHKLEFKPHPRLMPATQSPTIQQIPIPILELGLSPTLTPDSYSSDDSSGEKKGKQRKSRDRRKKSRDQGRLTHRTLWANASNNNAYSIMRAIQNNPNILQQPQYSNLQQPLILTGGSSMASAMQSPFMLPQTGRNDESFHGSASTWNINHPNNQLQSYYSGNGNIGSDSQENRYVQGYPRSASVQNFQIGYPPLQQQQHHQMSQPFTSQQQLSSAPQSYSIPMPDQIPDNFFSPQQQQLHSSPLGGSNGNGGPFVVYVTPSGRMVTQTSASGPIPMKAFSNINEIPIEIGHKPQLNFNQNYFSGPNHVSHGASQSGNNPQYMRNNFLRMVMDKLANVGKVLPIPFVTKYSHSPQGYGRSNHLNRRM